MTPTLMETRETSSADYTPEESGEITTYGPDSPKPILETSVTTSPHLEEITTSAASQTTSPHLEEITFSVSETTTPHTDLDPLTSSLVSGKGEARRSMLD